MWFTHLWDHDCKYKNFALPVLNVKFIIFVLYMYLVLIYAVCKIVSIVQNKILNCFYHDFIFVYYNIVIKKREIALQNKRSHHTTSL